MSRLFDRLASPFREFGARAGVFYLCDRLLRGLSAGRVGLYVYELMVQPIGGKPLLSAKMASRLRWEEFGPEHPQVALMPARADIKASRFAQGARCLGVYRDQDLLGYLWYRTGAYDEDEVRARFVLSPPAQSIFDFDLYVMPAHRMGLGFMGLWHMANQFLMEQGIRYTFSRLTRFNLPSRRAHAHLGWKRVAGLVCLKAGPLELLACTGRPWLACTWSDRQKVPIPLLASALQPLPAPQAAGNGARR